VSRLRDDELHVLYSSPNKERFKVSGTCARLGLNRQIRDHWIGRRGTVEWPPRSPDLTPIDLYLWGNLKAMVHQGEMQNMHHLKEHIGESCLRITPDGVRESSPRVEEMHPCVLSV
jgi:hypothetical protein